MQLNHLNAPYHFHNLIYEDSSIDSKDQKPPLAFSNLYRPTDSYFSFHPFEGFMNGKIALISRINSLSKSTIPNLPYKIIELISNDLWFFLVKKISQSVCIREILDVEAKTSCIFNAFLVASLLLGKSEAKKAIHRISFMHWSPCIFSKEGLLYQLYIKDLFCGEYVNFLDKNLSDKEYTSEKAKKMICGYLKPMDRYREFTQSILENNKEKIKESNLNIKNHFEKALGNLAYNFNLRTIEKLQSKIEKNKDEVSEDRSFLYFVAIMMPRDYSNIISNQPPLETFENKNTRCNYYHVFLIEQFKGEDQTRYRIYQSWQNYFTLKEYFELAGTGKIGLPFEKLKENIQEFKNLFERSNFAKNESEIFKCFEANLDSNTAFPPSFFSTYSKTFYGLSLRYLVRPFNPRNALENFLSINPSIEKNIYLDLFRNHVP